MLHMYDTQNKSYLFIYLFISGHNTKLFEQNIAQIGVFIYNNFLMKLKMLHV